ncbi:hypothetical protein BDN72DRAFT_841173 [Pluteus cervinus]|uniref:Uncharacterized protein n=1 Tax=Pluteus cervinus TaxID=181527 RepID=A0ACD3ATU7_9AGAR|nr:hypothetical protein BDN72DRAFT_841173 [Pluteus cervinus]
MSVSPATHESTTDTISTINGARIGSPSELVVLARDWKSFPNQLDHGIPSIFFGFLNGLGVPTDIKSDPLDIHASDQTSSSSSYFKAFWSLFGIIHLVDTTLLDRYESDFIHAWPGIFKWSAFFFASRVQIGPPSRKTGHKDRSTFLVRAMTRDVIAWAWYAALGSNAIRSIMIETRGFFEIIAGLWVHEDDYKLDSAEVAMQISPEVLLPFASKRPPSFLLLLLLTTTEGKFVPQLLSIIGDIPKVTETVTRRLGDALRAPEFIPTDCSTLLRLIVHFSDSAPISSGIREAVMNHGAGVLCTRLLVKVASCIQKSYPERLPDLEALLIYGFRCIPWFTRTANGISWVIQVVNTGILSAFLESSPVFHDLEDDEYTNLSAFLSEALPSYLCYRSVIHAVDTALHNLDRTVQFVSLPISRAWKVFNELTKLTAERMALITLEVKVWKRDGTSTCSNHQCEKRDALNNFRKCGNCFSSFYCSKECQILHWKNGHKLYCDEHRSLEDQAISYRDSEYLGHLNPREAFRYSPYFKTLAAKDYPGVPSQDLIFCIDFSRYPATYSLRLKSECPPGISTVPMDVYQPGSVSRTIIVATCPHGNEVKYKVVHFAADVLTMLPWKEGDTPFELDPTGSRYVDPVERFGRVKWREYWGIKPVGAGTSETSTGGTGHAGHT